ncbi:MAG: hypothetical protein PHI63_01740 [Patescibacteria group bacterium]|nr:hypothetical protein [Patescibacteria group bacterium]
MPRFKITPLFIGLLQAAGLTAYVGAFALTAQMFLEHLKNQNVQPQPVFSIILFLLAFVISALICGSIIFLYPVYIFSRGRMLEALKILLWSALWLIFFFCFLVAAALFVLITKA